MYGIEWAPLWCHYICFWYKQYFPVLLHVKQIFIVTIRSALANFVWYKVGKQVKNPSNEVADKRLRKFIMHCKFSYARVSSFISHSWLAFYYCYSTWILWPPTISHSLFSLVWTLNTLHFHNEVYSYMRTNETKRKWSVFVWEREISSGGTFLSDLYIPRHFLQWHHQIKIQFNFPNGIKIRCLHCK